ncbi:hypothetical protein Tco_1346351 [Tanacetum coccineum]
MELYMMNIPHGRMVLESVEKGLLIWPTIEENGVTRPRKYSELTPADAIQADCDVKETNIIRQDYGDKIGFWFTIISVIGDNEGRYQWGAGWIGEDKRSGGTSLRVL